MSYFLTFMAGLLFGGFLTALVSAQRQEEAYLDVRFTTAQTGRKERK